MPFRPALALVLLLVPLGGCTEGPSAPTTEPTGHPHCNDQPFAPKVLYLAAEHALANETGPAGETPGNDVRETFLTEPQPWDSAPLAGIQVAGNVTFDIWVRIDGAAPFPRSGSSAVRFYLQFGSDLALASGAIREEGPPVAVPGTVVRINATLALPEGGFTVESGGRLRLLVASLLAGPEGATTVLHGNGTPSQVRFAARCSEPRHWLLQRDLAHPVILPSSQGSFAQAVPPQEGVNRMTVSFDLEEGATRLSVLLRQLGNPRVKNDMDLTLLNGLGETVYEAGSPFANETMVLWPENLEAFLPPGTYQLRIDSYSGTNYSGRLTIRMEQSEGHLH